MLRFKGFPFRICFAEESHFVEIGEFLLFEWNTGDESGVGNEDVQFWDGNGERHGIQIPCLFL